MMKGIGLAVGLADVLVRRFASSKHFLHLVVLQIEFWQTTNIVSFMGRLHIN